MSKKPIIIAEIGHNHNGNIWLAKEMIWEAKECGADIVKFQLYDTDKIKKPYQSHYWELWAAELLPKQVEALYKECRVVEIEFLASVFDTERVKWTKELGMKRYKIASRSIYDKELIKAIEKTGKPIIASLGMVKNNTEIFIQGQVDYLYCMSDYPATINQEDFPKDFINGIRTGFSDHTIGLYWAKEAIRRGATIIEKHFTLDKRLPGCNQAGSADPTELKELCKFAKQWTNNQQ